MGLITQVFKESKRLFRFPLFRFMDGIFSYGVHWRWRFWFNLTEAQRPSFVPIYGSVPRAVSLVRVLISWVSSLEVVYRVLYIEIQSRHVVASYFEPLPPQHPPPVALPLPAVFMLSLSPLSVCS